MSVSYSKEDKDEAKRRNSRCATISAGGFNFQGPVTADEERAIVKFYLDFTDSRKKSPLPELPPLPPPPPATPPKAA